MYVYRTDKYTDYISGVSTPSLASLACSHTLEGVVRQTSQWGGSLLFSMTISWSICLSTLLLWKSYAYDVQSSRVCVIPTVNSTCSCSVPCHTFDYYISRPDSELYQRPFLTLEFLPGTHIVTEIFSSSSHTGLHFVGMNATVRITMELNSTCWFSLRESSNITFSNLVFEYTHKGDLDQCKSDQFLFSFETLSDISFLSVNLTNHCGGAVSLQNTSGVDFNNFISYTWYYGISITNSHGNIAVSHSILTGMAEHSLLIIDYTELFNNSIVSVQDSEFHNGSNSIQIDENISTAHNRNLRLIFNFTTIWCKSASGGGFTLFDRSLTEVNVYLYDIQLMGGTYGILLNFAVFQGFYTAYIVNSSIYYHDEAAVRIFNAATPESSVMVENVTIMHNKASSYEYPVTGLIVKGTIDPSLNPRTVLKNIRLISNSFVTSIGTGAVVTMMLFHVYNVILIDCYFENNIGTALYLESSIVEIAGNVIFYNNTANNGAAIFIDSGSIMNISSNSIISFKNNHASSYGGAIYMPYKNIYQIIFSILLPSRDQPCFILVNSSSEKVKLFNFEGNLADEGGDDVFGGNLDLIYFSNTDTRCVTVMYDISNISLTDPSAVTSSPYRVCFCSHESGMPDCLNYTKNVSIYPGQKIYLSAFIVGQHFGTTRGTVFAQIMNKTSGSYIQKGQRLQTVNIRNCSDVENVLAYNIKLAEFKESETIILTTTNVSFSDYINKTYVDSALIEYNSANRSYVPLALLELPVYVIVNFSKCPSGFEFSGGICNCNDIFMGHKGKYGIECDIVSGTIRREYSVWIDTQNSSTKYSKYCPFVYCNSSVVSVNVSKSNGSDIQCIHGHSGDLCGHCQHGYSLAIGSSNCLPHCSDAHLWILIIPAVAGILLVLLIKILNITVTQGLISGLILYANIIQTNKNILLASNDLGVKVIAVFISWINLDFGIETCFSKDLDMYTKTWLQFLFPLYLWILSGGIVLVCKYSQRATKLFGNNAVHVLATIFLLSYNKLLLTVTTVYSSSTIHIENKYEIDNRQMTKVVWTYDGSIRFLGSKHAILFAFSTAVLVVFCLPYTLCILLGHWLQRYNHYYGMRWIGRIRPLLEAYYGPLKDSHRYWVGVLLLARVVVLAPAADPFTSPRDNMLTVIVLCSFLLLFTLWVGRVYKLLYLTMIESALLTNLVLFASLTLYSQGDSRSQHISVYVLVGMVLLGLLPCFIRYQLIKFHSRNRDREYSNLEGSTINNDSTNYDRLQL